MWLHLHMDTRVPSVARSQQPACCRALHAPCTEHHTTSLDWRPHCDGALGQCVAAQGAPKKNCV
eukprot:CAMPEP_0176245750 /NCGR_PEP_ID=MMETSP0121_2-20121125/32099_1 /TAXON_ID=160619 /ORGANISM="Kryptoperidinium foliaceum, Strain CCMP 1326" /LENGTH=63 /DNA_ID=CAMNT_0017585381 /DNA_START=116 /DNA_END=307 /DNA_ORIENTATION=+